MVLMRLFQTSRRFHVEIQPQLVLLQKTLLNIEGLGRQLDPDLDLWNTAKPFLESGCSSRSARRSCSTNCATRRRATPSCCRSCRACCTTTCSSGRADDRRELLELLAEQKRTNRLLQGLIYGGIGFALGLIVDAAAWCACASVLKRAQSAA